jgi:hypothetical protein
MTMDADRAIKDLARDQLPREYVDSRLAQQVRELRTIDYKQALPGTSDREKTEFLYDVTSFANAGGGELVYGVEAQDGVPTSVPGVRTDNLDAEILNLGYLMRDLIRPRLLGVQALEVTDHHVLVLRVPQSWIAPHMVTFGKSQRFYTRSCAGKQPMDVDEIRAAFMASEAVVERTQRFRVERLAKVIADETPRPLPAGAKLLLHIIPLSKYRHAGYIDRALLALVESDLDPPFGGGHGRHNLEGYLVHGDEAYCQFFRTGAIEAVCGVCRTDDAGRQLLVWCKRPRDVLPKYLNALRKIGVPLPLSVSMSLTGVANHVLYRTGMERDSACPMDRDTVLLPDVLVESYDTSIDEVVRPIFDALWNAAGYERCLWYGEDGTWVG